MAYVWKYFLLCIVLGHSSGLVSGGAQENLVEELLKGSSPWVKPPTKSNVSVEVDLQITINAIQSVISWLKSTHDEDKNALSVMVYQRMSFVDERLKWDPTSHEDCNEIRLPLKEIWIPDVVVYNGLSTILHEDRTAAVVYSDGQVVAIIPMLLTVSCNMDLAFYPYDKQTCDIKFSSWSYDASAVSLNLATEKPEQYDLVTNPEWEIIDSTQTLETPTFPCCPNKTYHFDIVTLELERQSGPYTVKIVVPSVVTAFLVLFTFLLPSSSGEKIVFCLILLLALIHLLAYLHVTLPTNSESILGEFLTFALFLDFFATIIAVILYNIADGLLMKDTFGGPETEEKWESRKRQLKNLRLSEFIFFILFLIIFIIGTAVILCRRG